MQELQSQGYIDEADQALSGSNIFVSKEVNDSAALRDQLAQYVGDSSVGVAVFSDNAALEASATQIVKDLAEAHPEFHTIIVAVGDDLSAGSHVVQPAGEALRIANEAEGSASSTDAALIETVQTLVTATDAAAGPAVGNIDSGLVVGLVLGAVAVATVAGVFIGIRRSRRKVATTQPLPHSVRDTIARLRMLSGEYAAAGASGNRVAAEVAPEIATIAQNATELFTRLGRKGGEDQLALGSAEYGETLRKLTAALDRDYFLDILRNPQLWDDPQERVREVRTALSDVSTELVENIKQVNARRGLHFQVSLDGVIASRQELRNWEREFGQTSNNTGPIPRPPA